MTWKMGKLREYLACKNCWALTKNIALEVNNQDENCTFDARWIVPRVTSLTDGST